MSTTTASDRPARSLRKRQPSKLVDDIDVDLETLLQEHEEKGTVSHGSLGSALVQLKFEIESS